MQYTGFLFYVHTGFCRGEGVRGRRQAVPRVPPASAGTPIRLLVVRSVSLVF